MKEEKHEDLVYIAKQKCWKVGKGRKRGVKIWYSNSYKLKHETTMKSNYFPGIVKFFLKDLPTNDYPVLNSRLFCSIWFTGILDKGINSLRDLFRQL